MEQDVGKLLSEARKQMVEQRRLVIRSLGSDHDRDQIDAHINMMMKIQSAIDVIDRVIDEERAALDKEVDRGVGCRIRDPSGSS
jgi:hypothetical protein